MKTARLITFSIIFSILFSTEALAEDLSYEKENFCKMDEYIESVSADTNDMYTNSYYISEWNLQPECVKLEVLNQNTKIDIVDELTSSIDSQYLNAGISSFTAGCTRIVTNPATPQTIDGVKVFIKTNCEACLTHEIGHVISNINDSPWGRCDDPVFINIWNAEKNNIPYFSRDRDNIAEWFAECYSYYIKNPSMLHKTCPQSYVYINNVISELTLKYASLLGENINEEDTGEEIY